MMGKIWKLEMKGKNFPALSSKITADNLQFSSIELQ
jgi:hypothetical protein